MAAFFVMIVDDTFFTALPSGKNAKKLNKLFREKFVQSLLHCITISEESLDISLEIIKNKIEKLYINNSFSPALFTSHSNIINALDSGELTCVLDSLKK